LSWPLVTSTLEGLRQDPPEAIATSAQDLNAPAPWREAFEAGVGSPLEWRCWTHMQAAAFSPARQHPIPDPQTRRLLTIADFAFPDHRVAVYVDGASIHVGNVLRRDRRIAQRLQSLEPPWTIIRLDRRQIDHRPGEMVERIRTALGSA
jgi:very-short-patch-repair endonuclease